MASLATDSGITRDPVYYEDDGNVILRADSTVFKVHKSRLRKMSTVFADLLGLPQSDGAVDGQTDEQPIVLAGDTAEQFRSLLWALYARPDEIVKYLADSDNSERWMRVLYVAKLAHKYDCIDLAQWALDTVANHCRGADSIGSPEAVVTLVQLYSLRDHRPSLDEWAEAFIRRTAAAGGVDYLTLLRAAAASSWDEIEYHAYNRLVCGGAMAWTALHLTSTETTRLLGGYHNLNEVLATLPSLDLGSVHTQCYGGSTCSSDCAIVWRECCTRSLHHGGIDIVAVLQHLNSLLESFGTRQLLISCLRSSQPGWYQPVQVPPCYPFYRSAAKEITDQGPVILRRCFEHELGFLSRNSPEAKDLWQPAAIIPSN